MIEELERNLGSQLLTARIKLEANTDLSTAALIALARQMPNDEWAQYQLNRMRLLSRKALRDRNTTRETGLLPGDTRDITAALKAPQLPTLSFEDLLEDALQKHERVIIAIDDLDNQDGAHARKLLAQCPWAAQGPGLFFAHWAPRRHHS